MVFVSRETLEAGSAVFRYCKILLGAWIIMDGARTEEGLFCVRIVKMQ